MCQIIKITSKIKDVIPFLKENHYALKWDLDLKGGDTYSSYFNYLDKDYETQHNVVASDSFEDLLEKTINDLFQKTLNADIPSTDYLYNTIDVVFFSRQIPEMEKDNTCAPYTLSNEKFVWMHGTIYNDKELIKKYKLDRFNIKVDSEIFNFYGDAPLFSDFYNEDIPSISIDEINGLYTALIYNGFDYKWIENGMGLYSYKLPDNNYNVIIETVSPISAFSKYKEDLLTKGNYKKEFTRLDYPDHIYVAFSGGMDISLSLVKEIKDKIWSYVGSLHREPIMNIHLVYFDYNSNAKENEIKVLDKMKDYLFKIKNDYINNHCKEDDSDEIHEYYSGFEFNVFTEVIDVKDIIQGFSKISNSYLKIADKNARGSEQETEENLSYVPYRNTIFVEILGSIIDSRNHQSSEIVLGLNLSEGQVFGDNNSSWLDPMEKVLQRGGKSPKGTKIISPYINKTKTNMIKDFILEFGEKTFNEVINLSFSCYYPKEDGSPCNECGSCILRNKAIERGKESAKKGEKDDR